MVFVQINCTIVEAEDIQEAHNFHFESDNTPEQKRYYRTETKVTEEEKIMEQIMRQLFQWP